MLETVLARQYTASVPHGVFRHKKKNGDIINVDIQSNPIVYKGAAAKVIVAYDITEKLEHIRAIEERNEKLKSIAWMQSHVIRAPLARIMGLVDILKNLPLDKCEQQEVLDYIVLSADELDAVIKDISDTTRA